MNVVRIGRSAIITNFANYAPFVYTSKPGAYFLASYWTQNFGTGEANNTKVILITQFSRAATTLYSETDNLNDCLITEKSWFWDFANQVLYVHFEHDQNPLTDEYVFNYAEGFCDGDEVVYIDDVEYLPLVKSLPRLDQSASIVGYKKQKYISGVIEFNNASLWPGETGPLDFLITESVYRNDVDIYYYDPSLAPTEDSLVQLGNFYAESFQFTLSSVRLSIQDQRKTEDITIPTELYSADAYPFMSEDYIGAVIPIAYGLIREIPCIPINGNAGGNVTFRAAESLTSFGTVQVKIGDVWTTKGTVSSDLLTGSFTLSSANARNADGEIYECKLVNPIGEVVTYASDVIKSLNERFLGLSFAESFYDTIEWTEEEKKLAPIGILLNEQKLLSDWNYLIQGGADIGFRYEITAAGLRTIRVRDNARVSSRYVPNVDILNIDELPIATNPTGEVFASVLVNYAPSYVTKYRLNVKNADYYNNVRFNYKTFAELSVESFLTNDTDAAARAAVDALDYSKVRPNAAVTLNGYEYLDIKMYEVITIELTPAETDADYDTIKGREYFGVRPALVLGVAPDGKQVTNAVQLRVLDPVEIAYFVDEAGDYFVFENERFFTIGVE